jgi:hypothetical protein
MYTRHYHNPLTIQQIHDRFNAIAKQDDRITNFIYHNVKDEKYFMISIGYCFEEFKWFMSCYCSLSPFTETFYYKGI